MTSLNVLTLNSYMFPPLISYFGSKIGREQERVTPLAQAILKMKEAPGILTMQELWSNSIKTKLFYQLKDQYPYTFEDRHFSPFTLGSGLAIYSKFPIERAELHPFKCWRGHHEFFAHKGFILAKVNVHKKPLFIVTTHLQAGAKKDAYLSPYAHLSTAEVRKNQLIQIKEELIKFIQKEDPKASLQDYPIILSGDLNMSPEEKEYISLLEIFGPHCNLAKQKQKIAGTSYDDHGRVKPKMIDHILSVGKKIQGSSKVSRVIAFPLSDHLAVVAKVAL